MGQKWTKTRFWAGFLGDFCWTRLELARVAARARKMVFFERAGAPAAQKALLFCLSTRPLGFLAGSSVLPPNLEGGAAIAYHSGWAGYWLDFDDIVSREVGTGHTAGGHR